MPNRRRVTILRNGAGADRTAPSVVSATIDSTGQFLTVVFSEAMDGTDGLSLATPTKTLTFVSGDGTNTYTYNLTNGYIFSGETPTLTYAPGDLTDLAGNPLAAFSGAAVTNNSILNATIGGLTSYVAGVWVALSRTLGMLWQDAAKTVAATADGDPVRVATDPYTGLDFTAPSDAARPLLKNPSGSLWCLRFDGTDDCMWVVANTTGATIYTAGRLTTSARTGATYDRYWNSYYPGVNDSTDAAYSIGLLRIGTTTTLAQWSNGERCTFAAAASTTYTAESILTNGASGTLNLAGADVTNGAAATVALNGQRIGLALEWTGSAIPGVTDTDIYAQFTTLATPSAGDRTSIRSLLGAL